MPAGEPATPPGGAPTTMPAGEPATPPAAAPAAKPVTAQEKPPAKYGVFREDATDSDYPGTRRLLWEMLAYVMVILVLGGVAIFVLRRVLPRLRTVTGKRVSIVETVYLGPRQTVHLLQVGRHKFLVAGTRERISMLAEVSEAFRQEQPRPQPPE